MTQTSHDTFAAFVGIDWADAKHAGCLQATGSAKRECFQLEHTPEAIDAWGTSLRTRFDGQPVALCLALNKGPLVFALRKYALLVLFPINPLTLARYRAACTPSRAKDDPTDAELQLALLLTHRDKLQPLHPQSPTMRALEQLVAHRRRVVGDKGRMTNRLTRTLKNSFPQVLQWFQDKDTCIFCDLLSRWPTRKAAQLARRPTLETFFRDHHVRSADVITQRRHAMKTAMPLTTDAGVLAPHALRGQALVHQRRVTLQAIADFDIAIAQRAQAHPDFPLFQALPGAGPVFASRLLVALGAPRARSGSAAALPQEAGGAPVTARRGQQSWGHGRLPCPKCLRPTGVAGAAEASRPACWARVSDQPQRANGHAPQAAVRALACKGLRILCRGGQERPPDDEATSLPALTHRASSLSHTLAQAA